MRQKLNSVLAAVLTVTCFYVLFTIIALGLHDWNPLWFMWLGERYANLDPAGRTGYDGQFVYYIARDGMAAIPHLDNAPWRLQRILLPLVTRVLSLGQPDAMPWMLILINLAAICASTFALAQWLHSQKVSAWYSLTYSLFVGLLLAYSRNLTEPLAFCLAAWGVTTWLKKKHVPAIFLLALAALTRETAVLFAVGLALAQLAHKNLRLAFIASTAALPLLVWEGYLFARFSVVPFRVGPTMEFIPLAGSLPYLSLDPARLSAFALVGVPSALWAIFSAMHLLKNPHLDPAWLLLTVSVFMTLMPPVLYEHIMGAGRIAAGLVLAALLMFPTLSESARKAVLIYWVAPTLIWLIPILRWAPWLSKI